MKVEEKRIRWSVVLVLIHRDRTTCRVPPSSAAGGEELKLSQLQSVLGRKAVVRVVRASSAKKEYLH